MKTNLFKTIACIAFASLLVVGAVLLIKNNARASLTGNDGAEPDLDEDYSIVFYNMDDYVSYVTGAEYAASPYHCGNSSVSYYTPSRIPDGVSLLSIEITDEGTIFTYDVSSFIARDAMFTVPLGDDALTELLSIYRLKIYNGNTFNNYVTDKALYLSRLAAAIEASYTGIFDFYLGDVVASIEQSDNTFQDVIVGRQLIGINQENFIQYSYSPVYVPISVSDALSEMQLITIESGSRL